MSHRPVRAYRLLSGLALVLSLMLAGPVLAQQPSDGAPDHQAEIDAAWQAAEKVAIRGPGTVKLLDQAKLQVPASEVFIPAAEAGSIMHAYGNSVGDTFAGLVTGTGDDDQWMVVVNFIKEGYIKDDDAKTWNADDLLSNIREGTEATNKQRAADGYPELDVLGWIEPPTYDAANRRLVWSATGRIRNAPADEPQVVNYNTYALGRDGYFSLNLLTNSDRIEAEKPIARGLLAALGYVPGKRYEDFDGSTDKVAAYGLAALVGAVAVKKLGLLAVIGVFVLKVWKLAAVVLLGISAAIRRFFRRRPSADE